MRALNSEAGVHNGVLEQLVDLSARLGDPAKDLVILAEGNTSARADDGTFWVKASGVELRSAGPGGFVRVSMARVLEMLDADLDDDDVIESLIAAKIDQLPEPRPSVETLMHAVCLSLEGVSFVAHTHPVHVNCLACSAQFEEAFGGRIFPDEIVICGPATVLVPYVDPGLALAREVRRRVEEYAAARGRSPKMIVMRNHGLVALGGSPREVENITAMAVKSAKIRIGSLSAGGPRLLSEADVRRIDGRSDEHYRQRMLGERRAPVE